MTKEELDTAEFVLKIVGGLGAALAFYVGLQHYKEGQSWQKAQVLMNLMDSFKNDKMIQAACLMLDWDERQMEIGAGKPFPFTNAMLITALKVVYMDKSQRIPMDRSPGSDRESTCDEAFSSDEAAIRDAFDKFFDFFDKINAFRRNRLLGMEDLTYFNYWFELVHNVGQQKQDEAIQTTMDKYIQVYGFRGFVELSKTYKDHKATRDPEPGKG